MGSGGFEIWVSYPVFENVRYAGFDSLLQKSCKNSNHISWFCQLFFQIIKINLCSLTGLNNLRCPILSKNFLILMIRSSLAPKWPIVNTGPFLQKGLSKIIFHWQFPFRAVEASWYYFFENCLIKLKCPNLLNPLAAIIQENYQFFYPLETFTLDHITALWDTLYVHVYDPIVHSTFVNLFRLSEICILM